jgi:hypothetical protein
MEKANGAANQNGTRMTNKPALVSQYVPGKSFIDIGGLWGTKGEMVTHALASGASRATMCDAMAEDSEWWAKFDEHAREKGVSNYKKFVQDITRYDAPKRIGSYDFVHCTGVLYHVPDFIGATSNLAAIANEYLLVGTQVLPSKVENEAGVLNIPADQPLYLPHLGPGKRKILETHYRALDVKGDMPGVLTDAQFFNPNTYRANFGPWWWLVTPTFFRMLIESLNYEILESIRKERTLTVLARRKG